MVPTKSRQVTGATCVTMLTGTQRHTTTKGTVKRGITVFSLSGMLPATAQLHCRDTTPHNNNNWCTFMSIYCLPQFYQVRELTHQGKLHAQAIHDVKAFVLPHICAHINDQAIVISFIYTIHVNECEKKIAEFPQGFILKSSTFADFYPLNSKVQMTPLRLMMLSLIMLIACRCDPGILLMLYFGLPFVSHGIDQSFEFYQRFKISTSLTLYGDLWRKIVSDYFCQKGKYSWINLCQFYTFG